MSEVFRCFGSGNELYETYHDHEWGRPVHDDQKLFEMLMLEGAQAGLAWITVLKKWEHYRKVFDDFDPKKIALYDDQKVAALLQDEGIIRNRLKINAIINNAKVFLAISEKGSFSDMLWSYVDYKPIVGHYQNITDMPITSAVSDQMSKDLKKMGFKFVGSTIVYAFMQAVGMVNDHVCECPVYQELLNGES